MYARNDGKTWIPTMLITGGLFPLACFSIAAVLNTIAIGYHSLAAVPFGTIVLLLLIWMLVSFPLCLLGTVRSRVCPCKCLYCSWCLHLLLGAVLSAHRSASSGRRAVLQGLAARCSQVLAALHCRTAISCLCCPQISSFTLAGVQVVGRFLGGRLVKQNRVKRISRVPRSLTCTGLQVVGRNWAGLPDNPCRVKRIPSPIPAKRWYLQPSVIALMGGLLPFGSIFIEMYFVFTSFWNYKVRLADPCDGQTCASVGKLKHAVHKPPVWLMWCITVACALPCRARLKLLACTRLRS